MGKGWLSPWAIYNPDTGRYTLESDDATPKWTFPNANGYVLVSTKEQIAHKDIFDKMLAADTDNVVNDEDLSAALPITFTIAAQPDVPRTLTFVFNAHAQITAFTLVVVGTNARGESITETFTAVSGWSFESANAFATITSIKLTTRTGTGAGDTMDVGIGSKVGLSNTLYSAASVFKVTKSGAASNAADYSGVANITAEITYHTVDLSTGAAITDGDTYSLSYLTNYR